jgi:hypothetical protein
MNFHWPSFLLGCGVGAGTVLIGKRLRPLLVEVSSALYELADAVSARLTMAREDLEDVAAEGRAKARVRRSAPRARKHAS